MTLLARDKGMETGAPLRRANSGPQLAADQTTVLVVDDDVDTNNELVAYLTSKGFNCRAAADGLEALGYLQAHQNISTVVADVRMPGLDGIELVKRTRRDLPAGRDVKFILVSGFADSDMLIEAIDLGVVDFLQKPLLLSNIARALGDSQNPAAAGDAKDHGSRANSLDTDRRGHMTAGEPLALADSDGSAWLSGLMAPLIVRAKDVFRAKKPKMVQRDRSAGERFEDRWRFEEGMRFKDFSEVASDWLWETDAKHRFTFVSKGGQSILGKARWEIGDYSRDDANWQRHIEDLTANRSFRGFEYVRTDPVGNRHQLSVSGRPIRDGNGRFLGYRGSAVDISNRVAADASLRKSEQRLRAAQRMAHVGSWEYNHHTRESYWSDELYRIHGLTPGSVKPSFALFLSFVLPNDLGIARTLKRPALSNGRACEVELRIVRPDGAIRVLFIRSETDSDDAGRQQLIRGTVFDITDRKAGKSKLRESEQRLRSIMNRVPDAIATIRDNGIIESVNPSTEELFGWTAEELVGQNISTLMTEPDRSSHAGYLQHYARTGEKHVIGRKPIQVVGRRKDGSDIPLELVVGEIDQVDGRLFVGVMRDISDRQRLQSELIQASKLSTLGEMATGVAHELNQPLNVIRMAAESTIELIEEGECDTDYILSKLNRISQQTVRAADIIDHMRVFGRKAEAGPIAFDLVECVSQALAFMSEQLRIQGISVETDFPQDAPIMVVGHRVQLEQVVHNLVGNARDAIEQNGGDQPRVIKICLTHTGNDVVDLKVGDTGGGIPEGLIDRLFEPFFTTKEVGKGTGLGLSISYGIVAEMGGKLSVRNVEGGAEFTASLATVADGDNLAQEPVAQ
ncbi:MAG: PAS domain S-box protein [Proteobacteria bacterium]|nr:PAS domain S-box protein [Pseudomonadota bacterium]